LGLTTPPTIKRGRSSGSGLKCAESSHFLVNVEERNLKDSLRIREQGEGVISRKAWYQKLGEKGEERPTNRGLECRNSATSEIYHAEVPPRGERPEAAKEKGEEHLGSDSERLGWCLKKGPNSG